MEKVQAKDLVDAFSKFVNGSQAVDRQFTSYRSEKAKLLYTFLVACDRTYYIHQGLSHCFVSEVSVEYLHRLSILCGQFSNMFFISFLRLCVFTGPRSPGGSCAPLLEP